MNISFRVVIDIEVDVAGIDPEAIPKLYADEPEIGKRVAAVNRELLARLLSDRALFNRYVRHTAALALESCSTMGSLPDGIVLNSETDFLRQLIGRLSPENRAIAREWDDLGIVSEHTELFLEAIHSTIVAAELTPAYDVV